MRTTTVFVSLSLLLLGGCATMSEQECLVSDWRAIGYEDGVQGRSEAVIGKL